MAEPSKQEAAEALECKSPIQSIDDYRLEALRKLGFSQYQSNVLLGIHGLYVACIRENYIRKGCSPEQAYRILRP